MVAATCDRYGHMVTTGKLYDADQINELHALLHLGKLDLIEVFDGDLVEDLAVRVPRPHLTHQRARKKRTRTPK